MISSILFCDEAIFTRDGINNHRNEHVWATENPHTITETHFQHRFSVMVWGGVIGNCLLGPFIFNENLKSKMYRNFLEFDLPGLLENVPLQVRRRMWYMQDGAPPHYGRAVTDYLNKTFPNRWLGRNGFVRWPPRSPDLNPMDFFIWGHLKTVVYSKNKPTTKDELLQRIHASFDEIKGNMEKYNWQMELKRRVDLCITESGRHVEKF